MAISEKERRYDEFFQLPLATLHAEHRLASSKRGDGGRWHGFSSGASGVIYRIAFIQGRNPAVRLVIDRNQSDWNRWLFHTLSQRRQTIESDISRELEWDYVANRRRCLISRLGYGEFGGPQETWPEMQSWMVDGLLEFVRVFDPHLRELVR